MATKTQITRSVLKQEGGSMGVNLSDAQREKARAFLAEAEVPDVTSGFPCGSSASMHKYLDGKQRLEVKRSGDFTYVRGTYRYKQYGASGGETHTTRVMLYKDRVLCTVEAGPGSRGDWTVATDGLLHVELPQDHPDHATVWGVGEIDWSRHDKGYAPTLRTFSDSPKDFDTTALWMLRNPVEAVPYAEAMLKKLDKALGPVPTMEALQAKLIDEIATCKQCKLTGEASDKHRATHMRNIQFAAKRLREGRNHRAYLARQKESK